jgi:hypothetical protein
VDLPTILFTGCATAPFFKYRFSPAADSLDFAVKQTLVEALAEDPVTLAELLVLCEFETLPPPQHAH